MEKSQIFREAAKLATVCGDVGFVRKISVEQFFMTRSTVKLSVFGDSSACREHTHPRDRPDTYPKGAVGINANIGPALDVVVTKRHDLYWTEVKVDSIKVMERSLGLSAGV